ncbi:MAG: 16S rRNA (uracil(1498)-N(3))-methyltransferase [Phycisphaerae bacterium]
MNLILFADNATDRTLDPDDPRTIHVRSVLRMGIGDTIDVGVINGARGKATIRSNDANGITLAIEWGSIPTPPFPIHLLLALPRPQTARRLLRECTALGVASMAFFKSEKGEPSYRQSRLWHGDEWRRHLIHGAEQAFTTHIPGVTHFDTISDCLKTAREDTSRVALDVYEAVGSIAHWDTAQPPVTMAIGPERGFSDADRRALRSAGFELRHLGHRVLRTETAAIAATAVISARFGFLSTPHAP